MELDSHADTCVFGNHCLVLNDTGAQVSVDGFTSAVGTITKVQVVTAAVAHDDPTTLQTYTNLSPSSLHPHHGQAPVGNLSAQVPWCDCE